MLEKSASKPKDWTVKTKGKTEAALKKENDLLRPHWLLIWFSWQVMSPDLLYNSLVTNSIYWSLHTWPLVLSLWLGTSCLSSVAKMLTQNMLWYSLLVALLESCFWWDNVQQQIQIMPLPEWFTALLCCSLHSHAQSPPKWVFAFFKFVSFRICPLYCNFDYYILD